MSGFLARSAVSPFLCGNAAKSIWAGNPHTLAPRTLMKYFPTQQHQSRAAVGFVARHIPATARFRPSGALPKPRAARFRPSGVLPSLPRRISDLRERSRYFPGAFPTFGSAPKASPAHFRPLGVLPRLPRHIFSLWECSRRFPSAFPCFGSAPLAFPAQFCPSGAFPRLSGVRPKAYIGIVRAWRGNHTKSFHQEDEPWHRQQWQR